MRITSGLHRGRPLLAPDGRETRPTSDRARESIFNILRHRFPLDGAAVLDVFAGTGALGLEALSQGAAHAAFMESAPAALDFCRRNIAVLKEQARSAVFAGDALAPARRPAALAPRTLVFLDPPYGKDMGAAALTALAEKDWLAPGALCVMEMSKKAPEILPAGFTLQDERIYGIALIRFVTRDGII